MTYLGFLVLFGLIPSAILFWATRGVQPPSTRMQFSRALVLVAIVGFAYTTPWDSYLVYSGVRSFGEDRVLGSLFRVPYEEAAFILLYPLMIGLWVRREMSKDAVAAAPVGAAGRWILFAIPAVLSAAGGVLLLSAYESGRAAGLILVWAGPAIAGLALFAGRSILARRLSVLRSIAGPAVYFWICDRLAIANGLWKIDAPRSLGLPVEEAVFHLAAVTMVVFGLVITLFGPGTLPAAEPAISD